APHRRARRRDNTVFRSPPSPLVRDVAPPCPDFVNWPTTPSLLTSRYLRLSNTCGFLCAHARHPPFHDTHGRSRQTNWPPHRREITSHRHRVCCDFSSALRHNRPLAR